MFAEDPGRADQLTRKAGDLVVDMSKHLIDDEVLDALLDLAMSSGLPGRIESMFAGDHINNTEDRAVLHVALRAGRDDTFVTDGIDVVPEVHRTLDRMASFADAVRGGQWLGHTGKPIRSVVNIGIGGSDLGPSMGYRALRPYVRPGLEAHFVSNVDPAHLHSVLDAVEADSTLFVVVSKSFTTQETLLNARAARSWLVDRLGTDGAVASHFVAVSVNRPAAAEFGIDDENVFGFWDWVGGRYSMCSAVGLALMIAIGPTNFREMLQGFRLIDNHFRYTALPDNVPALLGMLGIWYRNVLGLSTHAVLPYSHDLGLLPAYLQQLDMESNGKRVHNDGSTVTGETGPIVWGAPGTNGQHAFHQLLHQGTTVVPADLIGFVEPHADLAGQHDVLFGNMLAQAEAMAFGKTAAEVSSSGGPERLVPHRVLPGNRPTSVVLAPKLTPSTLGQLVAMYEHKVFTQGVIWGINSFDQWGVELGKELAGTILEEVTSPEPPSPGHDSSTDALIRRYRTGRNRNV